MALFGEVGAVILGIVALVVIVGVTLKYYKKWKKSKEP